MLAIPNLQIRIKAVEERVMFVLAPQEFDLLKSTVCAEQTDSSGKGPIAAEKKTNREMHR